MTEGTGRAILYITIAVVLIVVVNKIFGKSEQQANDESDLLKLKDKGIVPTYPDSAYTSYANDFDDALDHVLGAEDFEALKGIIGNMHNDADMLKLEIAYGSRFHFFLSYAGYYDLKAFTRKKLTGIFGNTDEVDELNAILQGKGITYRF